MKTTLRTISALAAISLLLPPGAQAATTTVRMVDAEFRPRSVRVPAGTDIRWRNDGSIQHTTTTKRAYPGGWDKRINPGRSWTRRFQFAGTFGYYCRPHSDGANGMVGRVQVPTRVVPKQGGTTTSFTIYLASALPPDRWAIQVQRKVNTNGWNLFKDRIVKRQISYRSNVSGTHRFRARLVRKNLSVIHGWSPVGAAKIS